MRFFLTNFLVTVSAYALTSFVYPSEATIVPRICLMWASPVIGMLVASILTGVALLGSAFGAQALAMYTVCGIYCLVYHEKTPIDTLEYATFAYFLPGAVVALLVGIFAKSVLGNAKGRKNRPIS
jgi:hypothetical protein